MSEIYTVTVTNEDAMRETYVVTCDSMKTAGGVAEDIIKQWAKDNEVDITDEDDWEIAYEHNRSGEVISFACYDFSVEIDCQSILTKVGANQ